LATLNLGAEVDDEPARVPENRRRAAAALGADLDDMVTAEQVHGTEVAHISRTDGLERGVAGNPVAGTCDALMTAEAGPLLAVLVADCVPVLLFDPQAPAAAAVHAGWRGTARGVVRSAVEAMIDRCGSAPEDIQAAIGMSIGPCCYEVDTPVIERFREAFGEQADDFFVPVDSEHSMLDLWAANRELLLSSGVQAANILSTKLCTACMPGRFFSHRREKGHTGRMAGLIRLRPS
jgi:hypothetical protein